MLNNFFGVVAGLAAPGLIPGHPRLSCWRSATKTCMPATSAGITVERRPHRNALQAESSGQA